ncbi:hypothetical protein [uncultured Methanofollis sp.]|nr:hypothetical protein [uncultured Methanofollis sp.]
MHGEGRINHVQVRVIPAERNIFRVRIDAIPDAGVSHRHPRTLLTTATA